MCRFVRHVRCTTPGEGDILVGGGAGQSRGPEPAESGRHLSGHLSPRRPAWGGETVDGGLHGWQRFAGFETAMTFPTLKAAAEHLSAHPTALVTQFQRLERDVGAPLYHRATPSRPLRPTPQGNSAADTEPHLWSMTISRGRGGPVDCWHAVRTGSSVPLTADAIGVAALICSMALTSRASASASRKPGWTGGLTGPGARIHPGHGRAPQLVLRAHRDQPGTGGSLGADSDDVFAGLPQVGHQRGEVRTAVDQQERLYRGMRDELVERWFARADQPQAASLGPSQRQSLRR